MKRNNKVFIRNLMVPGLKSGVQCSSQFYIHGCKQLYQIITILHSRLHTFDYMQSQCLILRAGQMHTFAERELLN